jgi:hypothetical protein
LESQIQEVGLLKSWQALVKNNILENCTLDHVDRTYRKCHGSRRCWFLDGIRIFLDPSMSCHLWATISWKKYPCVPHTLYSTKTSRDHAIPCLRQ